MNDVEIGSLN